MKRILIAVLVFSFSIAAIAIGSGGGKEVSWGGRSGREYLANLPSVPEDICTADSAQIDQFDLKYTPLMRELKNNVSARRHAMEKRQENNSKKMMENSVDMPGFEGKSQAEMDKMSTAERRKLAEKMMADKFGVTPGELKAQKKANKEGNIMANADWAKAMAGEMQANDLMKTKEQREADKKKVDDARRLTDEQSKLIPYVQGLRSKFQKKIAELDQDPAGLEMQKQIREEEKELDKMQRDSKSNCRELDGQKARIVNKQREYCAFYAPRYKQIVTDYKAGIISALPEHDRLDEVASELQTAQFGVPLSDASIGLNSLETVQDYVNLLGKSYQHNVGTAEKTRGHFCDGQ